MQIEITCCTSSSLENRGEGREEGREGGREGGERKKEGKEVVGGGGGERKLSGLGKQIGG